MVHAIDIEAHREQEKDERCISGTTLTIIIGAVVLIGGVCILVWALFGGSKPQFKWDPKQDPYTQAEKAILQKIDDIGELPKYQLLRKPTPMTKKALKTVFRNFFAALKNEHEKNGNADFILFAYTSAEIGTAEKVTTSPRQGKGLKAFEELANIDPKLLKGLDSIGAVIVHDNSPNYVCLGVHPDCKSTVSGLIRYWHEKPLTPDSFPKSQSEYKTTWEFLKLQPKADKTCRTWADLSKEPCHDGCTPCMHGMCQNPKCTQERVNHLYKPSGGGASQQCSMA